MGYRLAWGLALLPFLIIILLVASARARTFVWRRLAVARIRVEPYWFRFYHVFVRIKPRVHARHEPKRRGLSAHHHSGKVLAHHHTSYPALVFLILLATLLAAAVSMATRADSAASSLLSLTVTGPPPSTAATIDQPADGDRFATPAQTLRGTCPSGVVVELYRNGTFAGSTICDTTGLYAVMITLVPDQNDLVARVADALGQYGPDSPTITVYYDAPPPTPTPTPTPTPSVTPGPSSGPSATPAPTTKPSRTPRPTGRPATPRPVPMPPFIITSDRHVYQGGQINQPIDWTVGVSGGTAPYTVHWSWGDGATNTVYSDGAGTVTQGHSYAKPGLYQVTIRATDAAHREAVMQVLVVVNGAAPAGGNLTGHSPLDSGNLILVWPLLVIAALIVLSFWLGERHKLATTPVLTRA
jgi:hypothetical protein